MFIGMQITTVFAQFLHRRHEIDFVSWRKIMVSLRLKADATPTRFDKEQDRSKLRSRIAVNMVLKKKTYADPVRLTPRSKGAQQFAIAD